MSLSVTRLTWINVAKDLRLEWRSRDVLNSMLFFSLLVVVISAFRSAQQRKSHAALSADWCGRPFFFPPLWR